MSTYMSDSSSAALAAASAACRMSSGTRWNTRFVASQIHDTSSSKGFSSSCALWRLHNSSHISAAAEMHAHASTLHCHVHLQTAAGVFPIS